ncbi:MAG: homoserine kinase [Bacteriovoracaceae bacterium]|nr:homoserine kinase [Bacteroidota bacterium]
MIQVKVPCSTSNLGPGFDTLGLALNRYLYLSVEESNGLIITIEGNGKGHIATDANNLVYVAMIATAQKVGRTIPPIHLHCKNEIPAYGGLGGSGAAIVGGVFLSNQLLEIGLSRDEMLNIAVGIEGHPDNVSAAIFGGMTINCFDAERRVHCRSVQIEKKLSVVTCSPQFQVQTKEARKILPQQVLLKDAVTNIENTASLVAAMIIGDFDVLRYVTAERLHEQYRATLIPGYENVKKAALDAGALSFNISGAGPTVFAFAIANEQHIADAMVQAFERNGQNAISEVMSVENSGAALF